MTDKKKLCKDCDNLWDFHRGEKVSKKCIFKMRVGLNVPQDPLSEACAKFKKKKCDVELSTSGGDK